MEKILNIYIPIELHNKMKAQAALQGKSSKQYIIDLIESDLRKEEINSSIIDQKIREAFE